MGLASKINTNDNLFLFFAHATTAQQQRTACWCATPPSTSSEEVVSISIEQDFICARSVGLFGPHEGLRSHTPGDEALNYRDVFLGDNSFYFVLEFVSSFSSRSYPTVRKCTDNCGMNMTTNMALKTRTRCYSFDQMSGNVMNV